MAGNPFDQFDTAAAAPTSGAAANPFDQFDDAPAAPMSSFSTKGKGGKTITFQLPEGADDEAIRKAAAKAVGNPAYLRSAIKRQGGDISRVAPDDHSRLSGFGYGLTKPVDTISRWIEGTPIGDAFNAARSAIGNDTLEQARATSEEGRANNDRTGYQMLGNIAGVAPLMAVPGANSLVGLAATGAASGALLGDGKGAEGLAWDLGVGAAGGVIGGKVIAPVLGLGARRVIEGGAIVGRAAARAGSGGRSVALRALGGVPAASAAPTAAAVAGPQTSAKVGQILLRKLAAQGQTPQQAAAMIDEARGRGVNLALMDLGDETRGLAGALSRKPGESRTLIRDRVIPRQDEQIDRIQGAITSNLGPVANVRKASADLMKQAQTEAGPLYDQFRASTPVSSERLEKLLATPAGKQAIARAHVIAANDEKDLTSLGFTLDDAGVPVLGAPPVGPDLAPVAAPGAGRYAPVKVGNEADVLSRSNISSPISNATMPKRGPSDLVTWLRTQGGLKPQGGELEHYGITNAPRKGMDFAGGEGRFGKLVNDEAGLTFDDAAARAHEAGFFPDHAERPSVDEFLDALAGTHSGNNRVFRSEDLSEIDAFNEARAARGAVVTADQEGAPLTRDRGTPIDMADLDRNAPPVSAYASSDEIAPLGSPGRVYSPETLDYVKRGLDDVVEQFRDGTTGKLNLDALGNTINGVRHRFVAEVDKLHPSYKPARDAFAGPASLSAALKKGSSIGQKDSETILAEVENLTKGELAQYRLGARSALSKMLEGRVDGSDKVKALIGSPKKRAALAQLFGGEEKFGRFLATLADEGMASQTYARVNTGSMTAANHADDADLGELTGIVAGAGVRAIKGQGWTHNAVHTLSDLVNYGAGEAGKRTRAQLAAGISETDPVALKDALAMATAAGKRRNLGTIAGVRKATGGTSAVAASRTRR